MTPAEEDATKILGEIEALHIKIEDSEWTGDDPQYIAGLSKQVDLLYKEYYDLTKDIH